MNDKPSFIDAVRNGAVVCNIGQIDARETRQLAAAAKRGDIFKTRAPFAGNVGAMKTYYAPSQEVFARYQAAQIAKFECYRLMDEANR